MNIEANNYRSRSPGRNQNAPPNTRYVIRRPQSPIKANVPLHQNPFGNNSDINAPIKRKVVSSPQDMTTPSENISKTEEVPHYVLPVMYFENEPYAKAALPIAYGPNYHNYQNVPTSSLPPRPPPPRPPAPPPRSSYYLQMPQYDNNIYRTQPELYGHIDYQQHDYYMPSNTSYAENLNERSSSEEYEYYTADYETMVPSQTSDNMIQETYDRLTPQLQQIPPTITTIQDIRNQVMDIRSRISRGSQTLLSDLTKKKLTTKKSPTELTKARVYNENYDVKMVSTGTQTSHVKTPSNPSNQDNKSTKPQDYDSIMKKINKYFYKSIENQIDASKTPKTTKTSKLVAPKNYVQNERPTSNQTRPTPPIIRKK